MIKHFTYCNCLHYYLIYLQAAYNLSERQSALIASDESGGGKPEHFIQVGFSKPVKTCCEDSDMRGEARQTSTDT